MRVRTYLVPLCFTMLAGVAQATDPEGWVIAPEQAAMKTIKPFVGASSTRGHFDQFAGIAISMAHDVLHPEEPEVFGLHPGLSRVLEVTRTGVIELTDVCELSGSFRVLELHGNSQADDDEDFAAQDGGFGSWHVVRVEYDHCRLNRYGWIVDIDGPITFRFKDAAERRDAVMRTVRFGNLSSDGERGYRYTHIYVPTGQTVSTDVRQYRIDGIIPHRFAYDLGYLLGDFRMRIRGDLRTWFTMNYNNEAHEGWSVQKADNVHVVGGYSIGDRINPLSNSSERAFTQTLNFKSGLFDVQGNTGIEDYTHSLRSYGLEIQDSEFVDTDSGAHHVSMDGTADVRYSLISPTCELGKFSVNTLQSLYVPYYMQYPISGSLLVDKKVRSEFAEDGSIDVTASGQTNHYADFGELSSTARCWVY